MMRKGQWFAVLAILVAACSGAAETVAERAVEGAIENDGGDVDIDIDDGSLSVEGTDEAGESFSIDIGEGGEVPDGFPVPLPDGGTVLTSSESTFDDQTILAVTLQYDADRYDGIVAFYDDWYAAEGGDGFRQETGSGSDAMTLWGVEDPQRTVNVVSSSGEVIVSVTAER